MLLLPERVTVLFEDLHPPRGECDDRTLSGERRGNAPSDAGPAAGDQRVSTFERSRCHDLASVRTVIGDGLLRMTP